MQARSEQLRADLLRAISHDLRTPLTAISGNASNLMANADALDRDVATLHTHPTGYTIPSPADILEGFRHNGKAEYIAAGKQLRRWKWLKTPEADDIALLKMYDADNDKDGVNIDAYLDVIDRLVRDGYIKMEELS